MRAAHHSDLLEVELTAGRVPYVKYGGLKFLEAAHVKDFIAAVRLLDNPLDEVAWFRLLRLHDGIGPARARDLLDAQPGPANPTPNCATRRRDGRPGAAVRTALAGTLDTLAAARGNATVATARADRRPRPAAAAADRSLPRSRRPARRSRPARRRRRATSATLADYVANLTLDPPASTSDLAGPPHLDEDYLVLSTVHSAKGLEWDSVHVIDVVDGAFPSDMALSTSTGLIEEQRLFYVAATRARDDLAIYTPLRMPHHRRARDDKHSYAAGQPVPRRRRRGRHGHPRRPPGDPRNAHAPPPPHASRCPRWTNSGPDGSALAGRARGTAPCRPGTADWHDGSHAPAGRRRGDAAATRLAELPPGRTRRQV